MYVIVVIWFIRKYGHCQPRVWYSVTPEGVAQGCYTIPHKGLTMTILPYKAM